MMTESEIDEEIKTALSTGNDDLEVLYSHAHTIEKYWLLTKSKSTFIKGTRLLYICHCKKSSGPEHYQHANEPTVGDIGTDMQGYLWEVKRIEWA